MGASENPDSPGIPSADGTSEVVISRDPVRARVNEAVKGIQAVWKQIKVRIEDDGRFEVNIDPDKPDLPTIAIESTPPIGLGMLTLHSQAKKVTIANTLPAEGIQSQSLVVFTGHGEESIALQPDDIASMRAAHHFEAALREGEHTEWELFSVTSGGQRRKIYNISPGQEIGIINNTAAGRTGVRVHIRQRHVNGFLDNISREIGLPSSLGIIDQLGGVKVFDERVGGLKLGFNYGASPIESSSFLEIAAQSSYIHRNGTDVTIVYDNVLTALDPTLKSLKFQPRGFGSTLLEFRTEARAGEGKGIFPKIEGTFDLATGVVSYKDTDEEERRQAQERKAIEIVEGDGKKVLAYLQRFRTDATASEILDHLPGFDGSGNRNFLSGEWEFSLDTFTDVINTKRFLEESGLNKNDVFSARIPLSEIATITRKTGGRLLSHRVLELLGGLDPSRDAVTLDVLLPALQLEMDEGRFQEQMRHLVKESDRVIDETYPQLKPAEPYKFVPIYTSDKRGRNPMGRDLPIQYMGKINGEHYFAVSVINYGFLPKDNPYRGHGKINLTEDAIGGLIAVIHDRMHQKDAEIRGQEQIAHPNPLPADLLENIGINMSEHSDQYLVTQLLYAENNRHDSSTRGIISDSLLEGFALSAEMAIARKMSQKHQGTEGAKWADHLQLRTEQMRDHLAHINDRQQGQSRIYPQGYDPLMGILSEPGPITEEYVLRHPQYALGSYIVDTLTSELGSLEKAWEFIQSIDLRTVYDIQRDSDRFRRIMQDPYRELRQD